MKEQAQHTATPLREVNIDGSTYLKSTSGDLIVKICVAENDYQERQRIDYLLRAVNSHDALVEALRDGIAAFGNDGHTGNKFFNGENSALFKMRAALRLANARKMR